MEFFVEFLKFVAKAIVVYIVAGGLISYGIEKYYDVKFESINQFMDAFSAKFKEMKENKNG